MAATISICVTWMKREREKIVAKSIDRKWLGNSSFFCFVYLSEVHGDKMVVNCHR